LLFKPFDLHRIDIKARCDNAPTEEMHLSLQLDQDIIVMREII
jgi:hypothetical protein